MYGYGIKSQGTVALRHLCILPIQDYSTNESFRSLMVSCLVYATCQRPERLLWQPEVEVS